MAVRVNKRRASETNTVQNICKITLITNQNWPRFFTVAPFDFWQAAKASPVEVDDATLFLTYFFYKNKRIDYIDFF